MKPVRLAVLLGSALALAASLSACREEEQGRILNYQKGVYLGKPDTGISEQARRAIWGRIRNQTETVAAGAAGGRGGVWTANVRPPAGTVKAGVPE